MTNPILTPPNAVGVATVILLPPDAYCVQSDTLDPSFCVNVYKPFLALVVSLVTTAIIPKYFPGSVVIAAKYGTVILASKGAASEHSKLSAKSKTPCVRDILYIHRY